jgi:hemolysin D
LNAQLQGQPFLPSDTLDAEATAYLSAQQLLFDASRQTLADQLQNRQEQLRQVSEQLAAARAEGQSARNLMQLERDKQARMAPVRDLLPKTAYDPVDQSLEEFQNRQIEAVHRAAELTHRQGQLQQEMSALQQAWRKDLLDQLATVQKRVIELEAQQRQLTFRRQKAVLVAPDDGVVDQVLFNTVGGVVSPAQTLLSIVPSNVPLVVEAVVQNKDVGYLRPGLPVTVKVDTFDFQKYGAVSGKLQRISQDSTGGSMLPASGGGPTAASSPAVAPADGQRPTFKATIALPRPWLRVEGKIASLHPGMTVNAEMKVGKRRVIEFFLSPVLKSLKESINVR